MTETVTQTKRIPQWVGWIVATLLIAAACCILPIVRMFPSFVPKVGDTVIVLKRSQIKNGEKVTAEVEPGIPMSVQAVKGNLLWVNNGNPGWIDSADTTSVENAVPFFTEKIRQNPQDANAFNARGIALLIKQEYESALLDFTEAIRLNPTGPDYYVLRADCWIHKDDLDRAIADLDEGIRLRPSLPSVYYKRAVIWNRKHVYDKAIADYEEGIRLEPRFLNAYMALAWLRATCPDAEYRDGKQAIKNATTACEIHEWKRPESLETLAAAFAEAGNFEEAVRAQAKAMELAPEGLKAAFHTRLDLYISGKPFRDEPKDK